MYFFPSWHPQLSCADLADPLKKEVQKLQEMRDRCRETAGNFSSSLPFTRCTLYRGFFFFFCHLTLAPRLQWLLSQILLV